MDRHIEILRLIVEEYIDTGDNIGSKYITQKYDLGVSPATIRNDMAKLEEMSLIFQPYTSAGRQPTTKGLRAFVDYLMQKRPDYFLTDGNTHDNFGQNHKKIEDYLHDITFSLSDTTKEISFLSIPDMSINKYSGVANFLEKNIGKLGEDIFNIVKMLEDKYAWLEFIKTFRLSTGVNVFIGEENILPFLHNYSVILKPIIVEGNIGCIGIIGGLRMDYSFNMSAVRGVI